MAIRHNEMDKRGITPAGKRWELMPIVEQDLDVAFFDLRPITGANKSGTQPK